VPEAESAVMRSAALSVNVLVDGVPDGFVVTLVRLRTFDQAWSVSAVEAIGLSSFVNRPRWS
jgi:hypothetical protein